jgi:hypothetical protein
MKKIILALTTALLIVSCAEKKSDSNTQITGNIKGFTSGMLYLEKMNDSVFVAIDSVKMTSDSNFKFDFDLESPEMIYLVVNRGVTNSIDNSLPVFAEPGKITVNTELKYFFANAKITGSKNHELYEQFQKINTKFKNEELEISKEKYDAIRFNRLQDVDSIERKLKNKIVRKYLYAINFALTNKEYEVSPYVALSELTNANPTYLDSIQRSMSPKVAKSRYGKLLTDVLMEQKK